MIRAARVSRVEGGAQCVAQIQRGKAGFVERCQVIVFASTHAHTYNVHVHLYGRGDGPSCSMWFANFGVLASVHIVSTKPARVNANQKGGQAFFLWPQCYRYSLLRA